MGYDMDNGRSGSRQPRSRRRGQGGSRTRTAASGMSPNRTAVSGMNANRTAAPGMSSNRAAVSGTSQSRAVHRVSQIQAAAAEIPPPGGWDSPGSQPRAGWSHSEGKNQKPVLALDPSLQNGGRGGSKTKRRIITMLVAECFALLFIFGYSYWARTWNRMQRVDDWIPEEIQNQNFSVDLPQYENQKGHWGIYIFGVDSRGSNVGKDTHSDVNIVCDINHDTGEIRLVSVFRDSYLNINDKNDYNKINQAYFRGGPAEAAKALNKNLDLNIVDYVTFSWKAVADGINLLGGVDMEISRAEFAYINSFITETVEATGVYSQHLKGPGFQHLDGVQAVAYGRLRLMDTDYARTERQRKVIKAAFEKAKNADLSTLNQLAMLVFPQVATSVDIQDIIQLLGNVGKYHIGETGGFPFARGDANMGRKGACVIPQTLESNVIELHEFLYGQENYTPSDTVKTISAKISSDTGMYNQGVSIDHVSTSGGSVPRPVKPQETEKAKETTSASKPKEESKEDEETQESTEETSKDGNTEGTREMGEGKRPTSTLYPDEPKTPTRPKATEPTSPHPGNSDSPTVPAVPYPGSEQESSDSPSNGNGPANSHPSDNGNAPNVPSLPGSGNTSPQSPNPQGTSPAIQPTAPTAPTTPTAPNVPQPTEPHGPTSIILPDDQVISYDGPPG